jgi:hypothetical protein
MRSRSGDSAVLTRKYESACMAVREVMKSVRVSGGMCSKASAGKVAEVQEPLSQYEVERLERMQENRRLASLAAGAAEPH